MKVFQKAMMNRLRGPLVRFVMVIVLLYLGRSCSEGVQSQDMMSDMIYERSKRESKSSSRLRSKIFRKRLIESESTQWQHNH